MSQLLMTIGYILGAVVHFWTVIIAFSKGGFIAGILSFIFPVLSEIYWVFSLWGEYDAYVNTAIIATIWVFVAPFLGAKEERY